MLPSTIQTHQRLTRMRVLLFLVMIVVLCACCAGKKMWGARSKRESNKENKKTMNTHEVDSSRTRMKSKKSGGDTDKSPDGNTARISESGFLNVDELVAKFDDALVQFTQFIRTGKLQDVLQTDGAKEWLRSLRSMEDSNLFQIFGDVNVDDHDQLAERLLAQIEQLHSQKSELFELIQNPAFIDSLLSEIPREYKSLVNLLLTGNLDKFKQELLSFTDFDPDIKTLIATLLEGDLDSVNDSISGLLTEEQIEATRQELISNPELLNLMQIPDEVLRNSLSFSQFMKTNMQDVFGYEPSKKDSKTKKVRAM